MNAPVLTWEQKFAAINALGQAHLCMRAPGDWYVDQRVYVCEREDSSVIVGRYGNGHTPEDAVEDHFNTLTAEKPLAYVVMGEHTGNRRRVLWNGFMWADVLTSSSESGDAARVAMGAR
jgi:hypothetical protein